MRPAVGTALEAAVPLDRGSSGRTPSVALCADDPDLPRLRCGASRKPQSGPETGHCRDRTSCSVTCSIGPMVGGAGDSEGGVACFDPVQQSGEADCQLSGVCACLTTFVRASATTSGVVDLDLELEPRGGHLEVHGHGHITRWLNSTAVRRPPRVRDAGRMPRTLGQYCD